MKIEYIIGIVILVLGGIGLGVIFSGSTTKEGSSSSVSTENYEKKTYIEIINPSGYVNTNGEAVTLEQYVGERVILLDVMTYSCINCQRTFPYTEGWYEKYKDEGLIVIGLHTPEFAFEKDIKNVEEAMKEFGVTFPVVLDNDYATWRAYGNRFWPRKYLIDIHGDIVYDHIGEGAYEETEEKIRELLKERQNILGIEAELDGSLLAETIPKLQKDSNSPETYFGNTRNEYLGNPLERRYGINYYTLPNNRKLNTLYLGGTWDLTDESATAIKDAVVVYKYNAKEVYLVAGADTEVEVEVWQDGQLVGNSGGENVLNSTVRIQKNRLYKLIKNEVAGEHTLELRVKRTGVAFFAFTFG